MTASTQNPKPKTQNCGYAALDPSSDGDRFDDRGKIRKITLSVSSDLSPLPFRPEDFIVANPFVREILENGARIV